MKEYVKPELYCESFELSQHIAACGIDVNYSDENTCSPKLDPGFWGGDSSGVFNSGKTDGSCVIDIGAIDVYCYTTGANEAGRLFNS